MGLWINISPAKCGQAVKSVQIGKIIFRQEVAYVILPDVPLDFAVASSHYRARSRVQPRSGSVILLALLLYAVLTQ